LREKITMKKKKKANKILIVDDEPINIDILNENLKSDYKVVAALNGSQALKIAFSKKPPDLILLDIMMPDMDGYQVLKHLQEDERTKDIPVIFITSRNHETDEEYGLKIGARDYITKPFSPPILRARVKIHLELKNYISQIREKDLQLIEMDRIVGIGTLAAGIAHEINNPLGFIKASMNSIQKDYLKFIRFISEWQNKPSDIFQQEVFNAELEKISFSKISGRFEKKCDRIFRGIERIQSIITNFMSFSRLNRREGDCFDINSSIDNIVFLLSSEKQNINFTKKLSSIPNFLCNPKEINLCLMNVVKNAVDAISDKGNIILSTSYDKIEKRITITIKDNGVGMPEKVKRQAFHPFFTTKPVGSGTGVGLSITEQLVKKHNGQITIDSTENKGTTVIITFPMEVCTKKGDEGDVQKVLDAGIF